MSNIDICCDVYDANVDDQGRVVAYPVWPSGPEGWFYIQCSESVHPARWQCKKLILDGFWGAPHEGRRVFHPVVQVFCASLGQGG
jgi:hypothetical protein